MKTVTKKIRSSRSNIDEIEKLLISINREFKLPEEKFNNLMIAVTEILLNAIVHGNKLNEEKMVTICIDYDDDEIKVKICDEGNGFDYSDIPDPTSEENLFKASGRGMYIVRALVKDFKYEKTDKGLEITLIVNKK